MVLAATRGLRPAGLKACPGLERLALELEHARGVERRVGRALVAPPPAEPVEQPTQLLLERADVLGDRGLGQNSASAASRRT